MLLNDYPQFIFTKQDGNCFMPTQAEKECRRITSIMNNHEKQQALTENREYHISNIHPHLFRHTFITLCYESHMDPASIMLISGHNDIDMMKHYTHPDSVFINSEFNKYTGYMHNYSFRSNATIDQDLQIWSKDGQISIPQTLKPL